jgi:iron(III) transport system substrate-binding protein
MNTTTGSRLVALAAAGLLLAGCADAADSAASDGGGPLVVYSNSVSDGRGDFLVEQASAAGFDVEFVDLGGGEVTDRIIAEKNNPVADVVFGPNDVGFEHMDEAGALEAYEPSWAGLVDGGGSAGTYFPVVQEPIMLVYNPAAYPAGAEVPGDWTDLWTQEEFWGTYETKTSLTGATTQMVLAGLLSRYRDDSGHLGVSDEGWEAIEQFFAHGSPEVEGTDLYARMAAGDVNVGQIWLAGKVSREAQYGITTEPVPSDVGVPIVHQNIGVVKDGGDVDRAQEFVDWFGSAEVQAAWSTEFFTAPTNTDALATADQDAVSQTAAFTAQDVDWEWVADNLDQWVEEIQLDHLG